MNESLLSKGKVLLVLLSLSLVSYGNALRNGFMLDDYGVLFWDCAKTSFADLVTHGTGGGFYRPTGFILMKISSYLFAMNPLPYHILNLILFIIIGFLVFLITSRLFNDRKLAFVSACLYCVHPVNNILVDYKTASALAITVICMQTSLVCFLTYLDKRRPGFYFSSVLVYFAGLFSHEIGSTLPLYLLLVVLALKRRRVRDAFRILLPYLFCFVFYMVVRGSIPSLKPIGTLLHHSYVSVPAYLAAAFELMSWYISKLFLPWNLLHVWVVPTDAAFLWGRNAAFFVAVLCLAALCVFLVKLKKREIIFNLTFFLLGFIPFFLACAIYTPQTTVFIEPHWFHFSSIGFFILAARFIIFISERWGRRLKITAFGVLIAALMLATRISNTYWKDEATYCRYWIKLSPVNDISWIIFARALALNSILAPPQGTVGYDQRLKEAPADSVLLRYAAWRYGGQVVAYLFIAGGDYRPVIVILKDSIIRNPIMFNEYAFYLAAAYRGLGNTAKAKGLLEEILKRDYLLYKGAASYMLGEICLREGDQAAARRFFEESVHWNPTLASGSYALAVMEAQAGRDEEALRYYRAAIHADPSYVLKGTHE